MDYHIFIWHESFGRWHWAVRTTDAPPDHVSKDMPWVSYGSWDRSSGFSWGSGLTLTMARRHARRRVKKLRARVDKNVTPPGEPLFHEVMR